MVGLGIKNRILVSFYLSEFSWFWAVNTGCVINFTLLLFYFLFYFTFLLLHWHSILYTLTPSPNISMEYQKMPDQESGKEGDFHLPVQFRIYGVWQGIYCLVRSVLMSHMHLFCIFLGNLFWLTWVKIICNLNLFLCEILVTHPPFKKKIVLLPFSRHMIYSFTSIFRLSHFCEMFVFLVAYDFSVSFSLVKKFWLTNSRIAWFYFIFY